MRQGAPLVGFELSIRRGDKITASPNIIDRFAVDSRADLIV